MPTTRTPVAMGSRVPACPTRLVPARRRMRATTSWDVMPPGLSTMTRACWFFAKGAESFLFVVIGLAGDAVGVGVAGVLGTLAAAGQFGVGVLGLGDQVLDPLGGVGQRVGNELERGGVPQAELPADLGPDDAGRTGQGLRR